MKARSIIFSFVLALVIVLFGSTNLITLAQQPAVQLPSGPVKFGVFVATFEPGGTFALQGDRWPAMKGTGSSDGDMIELTIAWRP